MKSFSKILRVAYTALTLPLLISAFSACNTSTPSTDTAQNTTSAVTAEPTRPADTQAPVVTEAPETAAETEAETEYQMNLGFHPETLLDTLPVMGMGMLGIFLVTLVIILAVLVLSKLGGKNKEE